MENNNSNQPENRGPYNGQGGADSGSGQSAPQPQNPYTNPYYNGFDGGLYGGYQNNGNQNNAPYNAGQYGAGGYYDPNNQYGAQSGAPGGAYQQPDGSGQKYVFINGQMYISGNYSDEKKSRLKKAYRRLGNSIGLPLCLFFLGVLILGYFVGQIIAAISTITGRNMTAILDDPNFKYALNAAVSIILLTVPFLVTPAMTGYKWSDTVPLKKAPLGKSTAVVMLGLGVCALSNIASSVFGVIFKNITGDDVVSNDTGQGEGVVSFAITLFCIGVLPALVEEFAFRGVILGTMRKYMSDGASIFLSAMLFALLHGNLVQIPFAFGVGLVLGYAAVYTGSMIPGVVIHGINNAMSVVLSYALAGAALTVNGIISMLYLVVLLLIGACGLIMLLKIDRDALRLSKERTEDSGMKVKYFCSSAWIIVFYVICALKVFITQRFAGMSS